MTNHISKTGLDFNSSLKVMLDETTQFTKFFGNISMG